LTLEQAKARVGQTVFWGYRGTPVTIVGVRQKRITIECNPKTLRGGPRVYHTTAKRLEASKPT